MNDELRADLAMCIAAAEDSDNDAVIAAAERMQEWLYKDHAREWKDEKVSALFDPKYYLEAVNSETVEENEDGTFTLYYKNVEVTVEIKKVEERW